MWCRILNSNTADCRPTSAPGTVNDVVSCYCPWSAPYTWSQLSFCFDTLKTLWSRYGNENVKVVFAHILVKSGSICVKSRPKWMIISSNTFHQRKWFVFVTMSMTMTICNSGVCRMSQRPSMAVHLLVFTGVIITCAHVSVCLCNEHDFFYKQEQNML